MAKGTSLPVLKEALVPVPTPDTTVQVTTETLHKSSDTVSVWFDSVVDTALDKLHAFSQAQGTYEHLVVQQIFLLAHLLFFGYAFFLITRSDWKVFIHKEIDLDEIKQTSKLVTILLAGLLITGAGLIYITSGFDWQKIYANPKVFTKIIVVAVMCLNAVALHKFSLPALGSNKNATGHYSSLIAITGAVSAVSWFYAAFVGASRVVLPIMSFSGYISLYIFLLVIGIIVALFMVRPTIKNYLITKFHETYQLRT